MQSQQAPLKMNSTTRTIFVFYFFLSCFFCDLVSSWNFPIPGRRAFSRPPVSKKQTAATIVETQKDSRLFYRQHSEDYDFPILDISQVQLVGRGARPVPSFDQPKPMDLPRRSSHNAKSLFDFEMMFGRVAMIASLVFLAGEIVSGLSVADQLNGIFY